MIVRSLRSIAVTQVPTCIPLSESNDSWNPDKSTTLPVVSYNANVEPTHTVSARVSISARARNV
jgi:hypothetical protein